MFAGGRRYGWGSKAVLAAEEHGEFLVLQHSSDSGADVSKNVLQRAFCCLHLLKCGDADLAVGFDLKFFVECLHVARGFDDSVGSFACAVNICRRALKGHRDNHGACLAVAGVFVFNPPETEGQ